MRLQLLFILVASLIFGAVGVADENKDSEVLERKISNINAFNYASRKRIEDVERDLKSANQEIGQLKKQVADLNETLLSQGNALMLLNRKIQTLNPPAGKQSQ